jgi:hypothetical protein
VFYIINPSGEYSGVRERLMEEEEDKVVYFERFVFEREWE